MSGFRNVVRAGLVGALSAALAAPVDSQPLHLPTSPRKPIVVTLPAPSFAGATPSGTMLALPALSFIGSTPTPAPIVDHPIFRR